MRELEIKIIGTALLTEQAQRDRLFREVRPSYFEDKSLGDIFRKLQSAYRRHPGADGTALFSELDIEERRDMVLMMDSMISPAVAAAQLDDTLAAFREDYARRAIRSRVAELAIGEPTAADLRALAEEAESFSQSASNSAAAYLSSYTDPVESVGTGFIELDKLLNGGMLRGTLATVGARPSTGKTTFAINLATHDPSLRVLFISIEMSSRMIYDRIVADKADVDYKKSGLHRIPFDTVKGVVERYSGLTVADDIADIEDIEQLIFRERLDVVIIDYIQIVTARRRFADNRQRIDYISQRLKSAAKKTGCVIVSLSQITRGGKDRPTMSDLKESGGLEQDSDYIILLYREYVNCKEAQVSPGATTVTLDKNKFGRTGELDMDFNGSRQRFTEAEDVITRPTQSEEENDNDLPF